MNSQEKTPPTGLPATQQLEPSADELLSGELERDLPAFNGRLKRLGSTQLYEQVVSRYKELFARKKRESADLKRTPGSSFNPEIGRVAQLLLDDGAEVDPTILFNALEIVAQLNSSNDNTKDLSPLNLETLALLTPSIDSDNDSAQLPTKPALQVARAIVLDLLRHAHMRRDLDRPVLLAVSLKLASLRDIFPSRLAVLLDAAARRFKSPATQGET